MPVCRLKLTQPWSYGVQNFAAGEIIEVEKSIADLLVNQNLAVAVDGEPESSPADKFVPAEKSNSSSDRESLTPEDVRAIVRDALSSVSKTGVAASRPPIRTHDRIMDDPSRGYKTGSLTASEAFGHFMYDVAMAAVPGEPVPQRLRPCRSEIVIHSKAAGSDELTTVEQTFGGFLIPPLFQADILTKGTEKALWMGAREIPFTGTSMTIPALVDETRTTTLYGGVSVYTQKERAQMNPVRPEFQTVKLEPGPITGICYVTDAMLHNYPAMGVLLSQIFADAMIFKKNNLFIKGIGGGEPQGILNSPCKFVQPKTTNQAAETINYDNIIGMMSHMRDEEKAGATILACHAAMPYIDTLSIAVGTAGAPIARFSVDAAGVTRLNGIPIRYTEHCNALGQEGDIILVDWRQYLIGRSTYTRADSSIHIRFDYNQTAFRFVESLDGQMWWRTPLMLNNSFQVSPVVTLAART